MNTRSLTYLLTFMSWLLFSEEMIKAQNKPAPLPILIPPSPNAAALGQYGQVPVGLFTGTIQQNIPLYTIETGDFSFPLSLNYQSNGIKVSDVGSNVGLGWVLDAGGVITRAVNDETDEYGSTRILLPSVDFNSQQMSDFLKQATSNNTLDSEADLFSFNFGGYAGKFFLAGTAPAMQATLINPSPLKIEFLPDFYSPNLNTTQIKITDPSGVIYFFGGLNAVEQSSSRTYGSGSGTDNPQSKMVKTAWNLTKILLLNGDEVNFVYANQSLRYDAGISQTIPAAISFKTSTGYYVEKATHALPKVTGVTVASSKLTEINWKNGKITLGYSLRFTGGPTDFEKIDNVVIATKNNTVFTTLKKYAFNYLVTDAGHPNPDNLNGNYIDARKRLFLTALITQSPSGSELNRYTFDYYSPGELPNRLSYAQDYWGYFNGQVNPDLVSKDVSLYNPDYYQSSGVFTAGLIKELFSNVGGIKTANGQFGVKGMLQKVTYPTGGYSKFEYESHTIGKMEDVLPAPVNVYLHKVLPPASPDVLSHTTGIIPFDQRRVQLVPRIQGDGCINNNPQHVHFELTVTDLQSNTAVPIEVFEGGVYSTLATPCVILHNDIHVLTNTYYFTFKQGKSYRISINVTSTCTNAGGQLSFSYYAQNATQQWVNRSIGGMRISKVTSGDLTGDEQVKGYYYGNQISCLTCSTGKTRLVEPAIAYHESLTMVSNNGVSEELRTLIANLTSNPLHDLYNSQGYHISYGIVTEGNGNNLEGGAIVHLFTNIPEESPFHYRDPVIGTSFTNVFGNGEEVQTANYKNNGGGYFTKVSEINRTFTNDNRIAALTPGFRATKRSSSYINSAETYNLSSYGVRYQWRYLSSTSETTFDQNGTNGSTVTTNYEYNSPLHMQVNRISEFFTIQNLQVTDILYPSDFTFQGTLTGTASVIKSMVDKHVWNKPIEKRKLLINGFDYRNIGGELSTYKMNGNSFVNDKDYSLKFNNSTIYQELIPLSLTLINSNGQFIYDAHYEQLNAYNRYDASDNLLELTDRRNTSSFIREPNTRNVWAKIVNGSYIHVAYSSFEHSSPSGFTNWTYNTAGITATSSQNGTKAFNLSGNPISNLQALAAIQKYKVSFWRRIIGGATVSLKANGTPVALRSGPQRNGWQYYEGIVTGATNIQLSGDTTIDELRLYPVNARMTSYAYKDGVGIITECNENNQTTFFEYDEFNRLKLIKDQDGYILKKNEYQYQSIQN